MPASVFTEELWARFLSLLRDGKSFRKTCIEIGINKDTAREWIAKDAELAAQYARAKEDGMDTYADEITDIADENGPTDAEGRLDSAWVAQQRLRVDARKWIASKLKPKKYGDKIEQTHTGEVRFISVDTGVPKAPDG